ncbi:MAG: hypothetical protein AAFV88_10865 [Planctomycetota bacterium]
MPKLDSAGDSLTGCFSSELLGAVQAAPRPPLGEGEPQSELVRLLEGGIGDHLSGVSPRRQMECLSGLWLLAGDIHRSHDLSQDLGSAEGSLLHGIMHRREGDFGNAKYWFRRVGEHEVFRELADAADLSYEDPFDFVDRCQNATESRDESLIETCLTIQWVEWQLLMSFLVRG